MKKLMGALILMLLFSFLCRLAMADVVEVNKENFPDDAFRKYIYLITIEQ